MGSAPYLIDDNVNGMIYKCDNINDLYNKVTQLLHNKKTIQKLGFEAYNTMNNFWSPKIAAKRIVELSKLILNNKDYNKYNNGPCSNDRN